MKKTYSVIAIIVVVVIIIVLAKGNSKSNPSAVATSTPYTVGAVFPISGPAALWGETTKNGMDLALEGKTGLRIIYEDSKGTPADGISAFEKLQNEKVDLTMSVISAVSVPLSRIAHERKIPLLVSLVAASSTSIVNDYTVRYYTDPAHYVAPSFTSDISPLKTAKKIAVLYRNDELGTSVNDAIKKMSMQYDKEVVFADSFKPGETDFTTIMSKIKASKADVLLFTVVAPGEGVGIVKAGARLAIGMPMVEANAVFADLDNRKQVEGISFFSTSFEFSLDGAEAKTFRESYKAKYNKEPNFAAAFGYDVANLIYSCKDQVQSGKVTIQECLKNVKENKGIAGRATQATPGDFVVEMHLEKVN